MNNNIPTYQRFQWINHPLVRKTIENLLPPPKKRGRKGYDKTLMFLWLMYKKVMRCSYRDLESITGIDYSTFIKFRKRLAEEEWFALVFETFSRKLMAHFKKVLLLVDSSFVETFSKHAEEGSAYSGYKEKEGFKFHALLDFHSRLPLLQEVTNGAVADITIGEVLIRGAPSSLPVTGFSGDKGYDSESFVTSIHNKWRKAKIAIPMRRFLHDGNERNRKERGAYRTKDPVLYRKRTEIERYFSRKKHVFRLGEERTRHFKNFRANCYLTSIMEILEWSTKTGVELV